MAFLEVKNLNKIYGSKQTQVHALKDVNFSVEKGEFVVILGASGAGKTTLLNILGGMDYPTSGEYILDNKTISSYSYSNLIKKSKGEKLLEDFRREDVGFVFQFYNLLNNLTAYENVALASLIVKDPLKVDEIIKDVGLDERKNNFPGQLSGGEQQRVSIARAIVKNPKLLLCDEPTGALDSKTGNTIIHLLHKLSREMQTTVLIVTHNSSIAKVADHLIEISDGKITKDEVRERLDTIDEVIY